MRQNPFVRGKGARFKPGTLSASVKRRILLLRGQKVMLDADLAKLYGIRPIRLREQVKRNRKRFPHDFMFQLTEDEAKILVSQNAIPSRKYLGGYLPYVFTQEGVAMLSGVLRSQRAVEVNIAIMRAFVRLRRMLATHHRFAQKLAELERKTESHDQKIQSIFDTIRRLMAPPEIPRQRIGFHAV